MRPSWKLALIGGEVTVLAAFTGVGIHLVMQPHHSAFRPPPITLPSVRPAVIPTVSTPLLPPPPATVPSPSQPALGPELLRKLGQQDRHLLVEQWDMLRRLTRAIEGYVEDRLSESFEHQR
jgi:hypothetical protein